MSKSAKKYNPKHPSIRVVTSGPSGRQTLHLPRDVDRMRRAVKGPLQK